MGIVAGGHGIEHPDELALVSRDPMMADVPALVDTLLGDASLRDRLGTHGQAHVRERHEWAIVARTAEHAYRAIVANRQESRPVRGEPPMRRPPDHVTELARRTPYWLAEWRSRHARLQDNAITATGPSPADRSALDRTAIPAAGSPAAAPAHGGSVAGAPDEVAVDVDCARLAAAAALDIDFDLDAATGYAGRSMVFLAPDAVLKIYTHRAAERAGREVAGLRLARVHVPQVRIGEVLGHDDVPAGLSWVATTRLPGRHPDRDQLRDDLVARTLGQIAARLHAVDAAHLGGLTAQGRRIRDIPVGHPAGTTAARQLVEALDALEPHQRPHCEPGFVHGDLSSRNVLLTDQPEPPLGGDGRPTPTAGVIDFEGSGQGCVYDDLATLVMQDGLLGGGEVDRLLEGYQDERVALGHPHPEVSRDHLVLHLGWRARWILQWAVEIDPPLTDQVLELTPALLTDLARARRAS